MTPDRSCNTNFGTGSRHSPSQVPRADNSNRIKCFHLSSSQHHVCKLGPQASLQFQSPLRSLENALQSLLKSFRAAGLASGRRTQSLRAPARRRAS